ncbi:hypothetical protein P4O66_023009 [Electrophorus voltai]|uniref:RING finger protein 37 n=1 Tax=Electrophorus voltai TaxID=2609070 RepID=A0AAD8ZNI9_9TELE|nr:hypothetical protein P4O66_023009 [Electrophorus voltai]
MDKGSSPRRLEVLTCPDFHAKTECEEDGRFKLVGRCEMKEEVLVCFRHSNFHHRAPFHAPPPEPAAYGKQQELWSRGPESLCSVGQLRISVPCGGAASALGIKSLAVWGVPARCCPTSEVEKIRKAHLDSLKPEPSAFPLPLPVSVSNISPRSDPAPSEMTVPEEFLDPLTLELMVLPMILPSGVVVDSSTLEEYQKQEATWGRLPNDPFTGVPFTKDSKPLPNPHLKSRIDSLRLKTGCSGVMGRNGLLNKPQPSRLVIISKPETPTCSIDSISVQSSQAGPSEMENLQVHSKGYKNTEQQPKHVINKDKNLSRLETDSSQASHEQRLSDSLDQALSSALYGLPTYTSQSPPESDTTAGPSSCSSCSCSLTVFSMGPLTYSLPCGHLLCRPCLDLKLPRQSQRLPVTCPTCKACALPNTITRVHH